MSSSDRPWRFHAPTTVHFGPGERALLPELAASYGNRAILVVGGGHLEADGTLDGMRQGLTEAGISHGILSVEREPDDQLIDDLAAAARDADAELIIGCGGGSVLDSAKALAALCTNPGRCLDYLEGIPDRETRPIATAPLPVIALPTTAGTGSEVTTNGVIQASGYGLKRSLRDPRLRPEQAIVDPELIAGCPRRVAAAAGLDAFAHNLESFCSTGASPITDLMAVEGMQRALHFVRELSHGEPDAASWEGMSLAALTGGWCLSHARLGAAHGLVAPLGGKIDVAHGHGVACLTGPALEVTDRALHDRGTVGRVRWKLHEVAGIVAGRGSDVREAAEVIDTLRRDLDLADLRHCGLDVELIPEIAAAPSSSIKSHPVELTQAEREDILRRAR